MQAVIVPRFPEPPYFVLESQDNVWGIDDAKRSPIFYETTFPRVMRNCYNAMFRSGSWPRPEAAARLRSRPAGPLAWRKPRKYLSSGTDSPAGQSGRG